MPRAPAPHDARCRASQRTAVRATVLHTHTAFASSPIDVTTIRFPASRTVRNK
jgi:hypothetical protein